MSDEIIMSKRKIEPIVPDVDSSKTEVKESKVPDYQLLEKNLKIAGELVDDYLFKPIASPASSSFSPSSCVTYFSTISRNI